MALAWDGSGLRNPSQAAKEGCEWTRDLGQEARTARSVLPVAATAHGRPRADFLSQCLNIHQGPVEARLGVRPIGRIGA